MSDRPQCPSCRMRFRVNPIKAREFYNPMTMDATAFQWIENAARVFDDEAGERFTAAEFVAWLRPDLVQGRPR